MDFNTMLGYIYTFVVATATVSMIYHVVKYILLGVKQKRGKGEVEVTGDEEKTTLDGSDRKDDNKQQ